MSFSIRALPSSESYPSEKIVVEIMLDDHKETFPLITSLWQLQDYQQQWYKALEAMVMHRVATCILVTDIQSPKDSAGITYWALFLEGGKIYVQERIMRHAPETNVLVSPENVEQLIPPRIQGTPEEHEHVSEWIIHISDLVEFLEQNKPDKN